VGEVIARGRNVMAGYWENPEATAQAIRDDWFYTGDLGRFDQDGNLFIVGRSKDVIIDTNGKNVYPDEVEDFYRNSPFVKELSWLACPTAWPSMWPVQWCPISITSPALAHRGAGQD